MMWDVLLLDLFVEFELLREIVRFVALMVQPNHEPILIDGV